MKRPILLIISIIALAGIILGALKLYPIYQGAKPAFAPQAFKINSDEELAFLKLPPNFAIQVFAKGLEGPRVIKADPAGNLIVSLTKAGQVVALPDLDKDGRADNPIILLDNLQNPHGLEVKCDSDKDCRLWLAETERLTEYDLVFDQKDKIYRPQNPRQLIDLPKGGRHFTRTLLLLPTDKNQLLISVGSTCDVCYESDERHGTILAYNLQTKETKIYAKGLRNSVFLTTHPQTGQVFATEMGRDWLGDHLPPDEINIIEEGKNYGWPTCYGSNIPDKQFNKRDTNPCQEPVMTPSYIDIPAHSAPLGLAFLSNNWPSDYQYNLLVAYHGSWNRTQPTGYKIVRYFLDKDGRYQEAEDFISGWLKDGQAVGRPVDIFVQDKQIYISDDKAGVIYNVTFNLPPTP